MRVTLYTLCICLFCISPAVHVGARGDVDTIPRNVILVIGDGMGLTQIAAHLYSNKDPSVFERFKVIGLQKTYSFNSLITDSGAAATAMACGVKTYNSMVGMASDSTPCVNLFELAENAGKSTGLIVTSSLVHATPAAFVAHENLRGFREHIAADFLDQRINYIVGGGLLYFKNRYSDERDLYAEFEDAGYVVSSYERQTFRKFAENVPERAVYFTAWDDPLPSFQGRDDLASAVNHGLRVLNQNEENGFFMLIEGAQIDFAGHSNDLSYLLSEMRDFEEALKVLLKYADKNGDTLILVTGDHSTGNLTIEEGRVGRSQVRATFGSRIHDAEMVPVFAYGPGAGIFKGIYENTDIFCKIRETANF